MCRNLWEAAPQLWAEGKGKAAVQIEHLWDALSRACNVDTLCGYVVNGYQRKHENHIYERICAEHSPCLCAVNAVILPHFPPATRMEIGPEPEGKRAWTRVPCPGRDSIESVPFRIVSRSSMLMRPRLPPITGLRSAALHCASRNYGELLPKPGRHKEKGPAAPGLGDREL